MYTYHNNGRNKWCTTLYYTITFAFIVCIRERKQTKTLVHLIHTAHIANGSVLIDTSHPPYVTCKLGRNSYT